MKISITVQNNEAEEYEGHLRVFIVEPESRWNDVDKNPYHFGVLAIPIDKSIAYIKGNVRPIGETYTFSKTWVGSRAGFGDITKDNIMIDLRTDEEKQCDTLMEKHGYVDPEWKPKNLYEINYLDKWERVDWVLFRSWPGERRRNKEIYEGPVYHMLSMDLVGSKNGKCKCKECTCDE